MAELITVARPYAEAAFKLAREANALIDRRTFSWTELLNQFQSTLPPDVRIAGVAPQIDEEGRRLVQINTGDVGSRLRECERDRATNAVASAGNDGGFVRERIFFAEAHLRNRRCRNRAEIGLLHAWIGF